MQQNKSSLLFFETVSLWIYINILTIICQLILSKSDFFFQITYCNNQK